MLHCAVMKPNVSEVRIGYYRAGLVEQITRDMQTLRRFPMSHPGDTFYANRILEYLQTLADLDNLGPGDSLPDRGIK